MGAGNNLKEGAEVVISLIPPLLPLVTTTRDIIRISQHSKKAKIKQWRDFVSHVQKGVDLVLLTQENQASWSEEVIHNVETLQRTLDKILKMIAAPDKRWYIRRVLDGCLYPGDEFIEELRREFDSNMSLFQVGAMATILVGMSELLPKVVEMHSIIGGPPASAGCPQIPESTCQYSTVRNCSVSSIDDEHNIGSTPHPCSHSEVISPLALYDPPLPHNHPASCKTFMSLKLNLGHPPPVDTKMPDLDASLYDTIDKVQYYRQLVKTHPEYTADLAGTVQRLSALLAQSGHQRMQEAAALSREAAELYGSLAEQRPGIYYAAS